MTARLSRQDGTPAAGRWRRLVRALGRHWPFVWPWSPLQTMTGVVVSPAGVTAARGRLDGFRFHVMEKTERPGPDLAGALAQLAREVDGPVCVVLPAGRSLVRRYQVPAEAPSEIEAMLTHLLAGDLPLPLEQFAWTWRPRTGAAAGGTAVEVHLARNDQLEEFLAPLGRAGLTVAGLVPEAWCRAQVRGWVGGADAEDDEPVDRSFVIRPGGAPCLAAAAAAGGLARRRTLLPPAARRRCRRRLVVGLAATLGRLGAVAAVVWLVLAVQGAERSRRQLADLETLLAEQAPVVAVLEAQQEAIRKSSSARAAGTGVLKVIGSLRRQVPAAIHLEHLDWVEGRGVTLRGIGPANAAVLELADRLAADPLWRGVRVTQLRSEPVGDVEKVHFVMEARLE
ncbi:MAG: PilN domain-containing protein [Candidatus Krumholzibacteriia bacterium]